MYNESFPFVLYLVPFLLALFVNWCSWHLTITWFPRLRQNSCRLSFWLISCLTLAILIWDRTAILQTPPALMRFLEPLSYLSLAWHLCQWLALPFAAPVLIFSACKRCWSLLQSRLTVKKAAVAAPDLPTTVPTLNRRRFLTGLAAIPPLLSIGLTRQGMLGATQDFVINRFHLPCPALPPDWQLLRIAQISDLHLGPFFSLSRLEQLCQKLRREKPDLLLITGDLVDDLSLLVPALAQFDALQAVFRLGIYFCLGNHEYLRNVGRVRRCLTNSSITTLNNTNLTITKSGQQPLCLAGVDYPQARNSKERLILRQRYFQQACKNLPENAFTILIAHHPDFIIDSFAAGIDLTFAGHTHGGQIGFQGQPLLPFAFQYMRGLYRQNNSLAYVNVGAGHWLPFRLGCPPEIAIFTLDAVR